MLTLHWLFQGLKLKTWLGTESKQPMPRIKLWDVRNRHQPQTRVELENHIFGGLKGRVDKMLYNMSYIL